MEIFARQGFVARLVARPPNRRSVAPDTYVAVLELTKPRERAGMISG